MPDEMEFRRREGSANSLEGGNPVRRNHLLDLVPPEEMDRIRPHLRQDDFTFRQSLYENHQPSEFACFPHAGVFSIVAVPEDESGMIVEIATIGNEGMVGLPLLLGGDGMPGMGFCQVPGQAAMIEARSFRELIDACPSFRRILLRYTQALITQISQGAACNRMHPINERCARWMLMTHDRVGADHFTITQEFLGQMLGVRRPSVSVAANMLQEAGLIRYSRGLVVITNREGLEAASCNCYRIIRDEFERLLR
jgi:CRP-like cAMP-binding protein